MPYPVHDISWQGGGGGYPVLVLVEEAGWGYPVLDGAGQGVPHPGPSRGGRDGWGWSRGYPVLVRVPPPPVNGQSENITFPRTSYAGGNNSEIYF